MAASGESLVFFDGVCGFCNAFVDFLLRRDHRHRLKFAPLQGETAKRRLMKISTTNSADTMVFLDEHANLFVKSSAAIKAMVMLGGLWSLVRVFVLVPSPVRDYVYDVIAKNRYKIFGRREQCRLPSAAERAFFLP